MLAVAEDREHPTAGIWLSPCEPQFSSVCRAMRTFGAELRGRVERLGSVDVAHIRHRPLRLAIDSPIGWRVFQFLPKRQQGARGERRKLFQFFL